MRETVLLGNNFVIILVLKLFDYVTIAFYYWVKALPKLLLKIKHGVQFLYKTKTILSIRK